MAVTFLTNEDKALIDKDIAALSEEVDTLKQNGGGSGGSGGGSSEKTVLFTESGEFVDVTLSAGEKLDIVTKINRTESWGRSQRLVLHRATSANIFDVVGKIGGVGTVIEKNGLTATINDDGTITVTGTNTSSASTDIFVTASGTFEDNTLTVYPAGTYTIPGGSKQGGTFILQIGAASYPTWVSKGNKYNTFTMTEPFVIYRMKFSYAAGSVVDETFKLGLFRGSSIPESDSYLYTGNKYFVEFDSPLYSGSYNWTTGELFDGNGVLISRSNPLPPFDIAGFEGRNQLFTGFGELTVTAYTEGNEGFAGDTTLTDSEKVANARAVGMALKQVEQYVTPQMYGASCDGDTDDSAALQAAVDSGIPVLINRDIAIGSTIKCASKITIAQGVVVNILGNNNGFEMGSDMTIDGNGTIRVKLNYSGTCIKLKDCTRSTVSGITIKGKDYNRPAGIGVEIVAENANCTFNVVDKVVVDSFMYGVKIHALDYERYFNTGNQVNIISYMCGNAARLEQTDENTVYVIGESGFNKVNNAEITLLRAWWNNITNCLIDTGNPNHNQYSYIVDEHSVRNVLRGSPLLARRVINRSPHNHVDYTINWSDVDVVPGVYDVFTSPTIKKTFAVFGDGTVLDSESIFDYSDGVVRTLKYSNPNYKTADSMSWGCKITFESVNGQLVALNKVFIDSVSGYTPYKVGLRLHHNDAWTDEVTIAHAGDIDKQIFVREFTSDIAGDGKVYVQKFELVFYGATNKAVSAENREWAEITALCGACVTDGNVDTFDNFAGLRKTGGTMHGDADFVAGKGVVLTSPNGTKYRLTVADDGTLSATALA